MSGEEELSTANAEVPTATNATETSAATTTADAAERIVEQERAEKILKAKELYSQGSRNFLVKSYGEAADDLSEVCALYEEIYGELSAELGMPYLLYAKSLIALAVDENKVIDVPDEADEDDEEDVEGDDDDDDEEEATAAKSANGATEKPPNEADSTAEGGGDAAAAANKTATEEETKVESSTASSAKTTEEAQVTSSNDATSKKVNGSKGSEEVKSTTVADAEKPSTSNGDVDCADIDTPEDDDENEATSNLRLAWEILELAAKIFTRQGLSGLPNLAEVQTELANIEFENNIMAAAREDYEKALRIYKDLPKNYHRAMAEIHYKIGLTYLMQQLNKEGAASLKEACDLIEAEITEIKAKGELTEKDKNNIQDMEETKEEIRVKIDEIEQTQAQNIAEVRAALDSYIKPIVSQNAADAGTSSSAKSTEAGSSSISSSSKPNDISHLIKRKKPEEPSSEAEATPSPAKRPAV